MLTAGWNHFGEAWSPKSSYIVRELTGISIFVKIHFSPMASGIHLVIVVHLSVLLKFHLSQQCEKSSSKKVLVNLSSMFQPFMSIHLCKVMTWFVATGLARRTCFKGWWEAEEGERVQWSQKSEMISLAGISTDSCSLNICCLRVSGRVMGWLLRLTNGQKHRVRHLHIENHCVPRGHRALKTDEDLIQRLLYSIVQMHPLVLNFHISRCGFSNICLKGSSTQGCGNAHTFCIGFELIVWVLPFGTKRAPSKKRAI